MHYTTTGMKNNNGSPLLMAVGAAVRSARRTRGLTRRELAGRSGVSERFLAQLEGGGANISLLRLADLARALETPLLGLLSRPVNGPGSRLALVGLRGA